MDLFKAPDVPPQLAGEQRWGCRHHLCRLLSPPKLSTPYICMTRPRPPAAKYAGEASRYWDLFYRRNETRFFKDRHYFAAEFPQLLTARSVFEVGTAVQENHVGDQEVEEGWIDLPSCTCHAVSPSSWQRLGGIGAALHFCAQLHACSGCGRRLCFGQGREPMSALHASTSAQLNWVQQTVERITHCRRPGPNAVHAARLQVGCGVGNSLFPLLELNPAATLYACDFAPSGIDLVKSNPLYRQHGGPGGRMTAFVADITGGPPGAVVQRREEECTAGWAHAAAAAAVPATARALVPRRCRPPLPASPLQSPAADDLTASVPAASVEVATMIFVLSAVAPEAMPRALRAVAATLRPGGLLLFRWVPPPHRCTGSEACLAGAENLQQRGLAAGRLCGAPSCQAPSFPSAAAVGPPGRSLARLPKCALAWRSCELPKLCRNCTCSAHTCSSAL